MQILTHEMESVLVLIWAFLDVLLGSSSSRHVKAAVLDGGASDSAWMRCKFAEYGQRDGVTYRV